MGVFSRLKAAYNVLKNGLPQSPRPIESRWVPISASSQPGKLLAGKNVFISGAGPNIGRSLCQEMGNQGANIYFSDLNASWIPGLENHLAQQGISSKGFALDVSKSEDSDTLCAYFDQNVDQIDVIIHNAALQKTSFSLSDFDRAEWERTYATNVFGPMYLTKRLVERMRQQGNPGSIIFITSVQQFLPSGWAHYSSSKAALGMIVKELALELASDRIRVNGIAPGPVKVDPDGKPKPNRFIPLYHSSVPPEFIGRAAVFLASDYYSYCTTGSVLTVDGGITLYNHHSEGLARKRRLRPGSVEGA